MVSIRPVTTIEECRLLEELQGEIWGFNPADTVPDHILIVMAHDGGIVLLAETDDGQPVGLAYGLFGLTEEGRLKFCSHQVGVHPAYQNSGIGYQLKLAQRDAVLARGLDLITWTFDPLLSRNAYLNVAKLGGVVKTYYRNYYGDMRDDLNEGLPSDRFRLDWWIASPAVVRRLAGEPASLPSDSPVLNPASLTPAGLVIPVSRFDAPASPTCLVEIPSDLAALKVAAPDLALQWRLHSRELFELAFAEGYCIVDLVRSEGRVYYILQKGD